MAEPAAKKRKLLPIGSDGKIVLGCSKCRMQAKGCGQCRKWAEAQELDALGAGEGADAGAAVEGTVC